MLRLVSIIGIAIAMVIGFIALSSKMKDDYTVRSRVVDVLNQMKDLATEELQCGVTTNQSETSQLAEPDNPVNDESSPDSPDTEITSELETLPLVVDDSADASANSQSPEENTEIQSTEESNSENSEDSGVITDSESEESASNQTSLQGKDLELNADIIKTLGYQILRSGDIEVITIFKNVNGESGNTNIQAGSRIVIRCYCTAQDLSCATVESNINKNYLPNTLTKQ